MTKSIEELLSLVSQKPKSGRKPKSDHSDVLNFIKELGIESGTQAVPNFLIYYHYRMIWKPDARNKAKKITFFQTFGKHLPDYRHGKQRFYMVSPGIFNTNEEVVKAAKEYDEKYWQKNSQKKV